MTINETEDSQRKMEDVVRKVQKLLNLAAKNPNPEEAASATAKANELLLAYNLDMTTIEQGDGSSGKREDARVKGGMYIYERELWEDIAKLNFCFYFVTRERQTKGNRTWLQFKHRLVGRVVNTTATKVMGGYLQQTIERIAAERFPDNNQRFLTEAVALREGAADAVRSKLRAKRKDIEIAERERQIKEDDARREAAKKGLSLATGLSLRDVKQSEEEANYDFIHGEGAYARRKQRDEEWTKERAEMRARRAEAERQAEENYTRWAEAHPEEAAKMEAKEKARQRAKDRAAARRPYSGGRYRSETKREQRQGSNYYHEGHEKGKNISIDPQTGDRRGETRRLK